MDQPELLPYRPKNSVFSRARGGILDGLDEPFRGSGLELFMSPEEIAGIEGLELGGARSVQDSEPRLFETRDNNLSGAAGDKFSEQAPRSSGIVEGDNKGPQNPFDKTGEDQGSVAGKIWNSPNSAIGMAYGGLGYLAGWPSYWLGLQDKPPGVTTGNNAVQFTDNPLMAPKSAITLGNVQVFHGKPEDVLEEGPPPTLFGQHEEPHTYQGEQLGPLYLPSNMLGGLAGVLLDGSWHGQHNWNEVGPQKNPPVPWPK